MSKNMGSKPATPSVIARLMGLDELPSKQPVKKQKLQRVLSENYLRKVASIGVWEKRSFDERRSFWFRIEAQKEFKDAFEVIESLERGKESDLFAEKGRVHLRLSHEKVPSLSGSFADAEYVPVGIKLQPLKEVHYGQSGPGFVDCRKDCFENHFQKPDYLATHFYDQESVPSHLQSRHVRFLESTYAFDREKTDIYRKLGSRTDQENSKLLQKLENCLVKDSRRKYGPDSTCIVPRFPLESNNERRPFRKVVILKPKPGEAENATNCLSSPSSYEGSSSGDRKDKGFLSHGKGNSHAQVKERKNLSNGVKSTGHRLILSCENEKKIIRKTRYNISDISLEPPRSGFSGVHSRTKETKFMMVSSPNNSDLNNWYKPSCYYLDGSYVAEEAKKQISERWRMKKEFRENGLTIGGRGRSRTLGEMLASPDRDKCANFRSPLGISSRDGWKNGGTGDLIKSRSAACSTSVERPKTWNSHKDLHDDSYMTMRPIFSLNWSRLKSTKQGSSGKDGLERRNLGSNCKKSQSSPYLESEKNHSLEDKYVVHNMSKNNLEKQDPSEESSIVSKSLKHNIFHPVSEKKITPIDQWNNIKDGNMSAEGSVVPESPVFTAESPSIASDMVVAVENVAVGKSTRNHNQQLFESTGCIMSEKDYNSSFCIPDASSQQKDISMKISEDYGTDPDFLLNLETAYQPSPVSVLEAPFGEEILSSSKCLQSVTASLHDVRRQLEFLKSESLEGYSEGPGMVVSSDDDDDDAGEESLENCDVNEDLTRLFGVEESKDFSYLVDVLTEAGFPRKQDIGFDGWHSPEIPISPSVFETLEKKYDGEQISWKRSARRLLFDRINSGLMEILQPCLGEPMWATPVTRRLVYRQNLEEIEKELYMLLVSLEKEARKDSSEKVLGKDDGWLFLGYDIEVIGREIENSLIDELAEEIVSLESF